jgi:hypothetical protein
MKIPKHLTDVSRSKCGSQDARMVKYSTGRKETQNFRAKGYK